MKISFLDERSFMHTFEVKAIEWEEDSDGTPVDIVITADEDTLNRICGGHSIGQCNCVPSEKFEGLTEALFARLRELKVVECESAYHSYY